MLMLVSNESGTIRKLNRLTEYPNAKKTRRTKGDIREAAGSGEASPGNDQRPLTGAGDVNIINNVRETS